MSYIETKSTTAQIVSLSDVQSYLKNTDTTLTAFLTNCISYVQSTFETYCQKSLVNTSITGYYDGDGTNCLYVANYPIISVSSLQYRTDPTSTSWTNFGTYFTYNDYIKLYAETFNKSTQNVKVIYTAGYTTIPAAIQKCAIEAVAEIYQESKKGNSRLGINTTNISEGNNYSETYYQLSDRHLKILDFYRKPII